MANVDKDKRKFLKHIGILGAGGFIGLLISKLTISDKINVRNEYSDVEIDAGRKKIWEYNSNYYFDKQEDPRSENVAKEFLSGGFPYFAEQVCAYHYDDNGDGVYGEKEVGKYCSSPCVDVCPVNVIKLHSVSKEEIIKGEKIVPGFPQKSFGKENGDETNCIGCGLCFRTCGYDAIQWINRGF